MSTTSQQVCREFFQVMNRMKRVLHGFADENGLTVQQLGLMHILYEEDSLLMGAVAMRLHCDASNVTGIIDRLVALDVAERKELPQDRRAKVLRLTPKGRAIVEKIMARMPHELGFDTFAQKDLDCLHDCFRKIVA